MIKMYPVFLTSHYFRSFIIFTLFLLLILDSVLFLYLVIDKILTERREKKKRYSREKFTEIIASKMFDDELLLEIPKDRFSYEVVGDLLLDTLRNLRGDFANKVQDLLRKNGYVEYFSKMLKSKRFYIRGKYAEKFGFTRLSEARQPLVELLKVEKHPYVIKKAVFALSFVFEIDHLDLMYEKISEVKDLGFKYVEQIFINVIRRIREFRNSEKGMRFLSLYAKLLDSLGRRALFEALGLEKVYEAVPIIAGYANSNDPLMRISVARALGRMGGEVSCNILKQYLKDMEDWRVRAVAANFAGICDISVVSILYSLLFDPEPTVAMNAAQTLLQFGRVGIEFLEKAKRNGIGLASEIAKYALEGANLA